MLYSPALARPFLNIFCLSLVSIESIFRKHPLNLKLPNHHPHRPFSGKLAEWGPSGPEPNSSSHGSSSTLPRMTSHSSPNTEEGNHPHSTTTTHKYDCRLDHTMTRYVVAKSYPRTHTNMKTQIATLLSLNMHLITYTVQIGFCYCFPCMFA